VAAILVRRVMNATIVHWQGKDWQQLRLPWRLHRCRIDTEAVVQWGMEAARYVQRCRCGAHRSFLTSETFAERDCTWRNRNGRRKGIVHRFTPTI